MPSPVKPKKFSSNRSRKYYSNIFETAFESSALKKRPLSNLSSSAYPSLAVHRKKGKSLRQSIQHEHQKFRSHHDDHHVKKFGPNLAPKTRSQDVAVVGRHDNSVHVVAINKVTNWLQNHRDDEIIAEIAEIVANVCFIEPKRFELIESDVVTNNSTLKEAFNCNSPGEISQIFENDFKPYESANIVRSSPVFNDGMLMAPPKRCRTFIPPSRNIHYRGIDEYRLPLIPPSVCAYTTDTPEIKHRMHLPKFVDTTVENTLGLINTVEKDASANSLNQSIVESTNKRFSGNDFDTSIDEFWKDFAKLKVNTTFDSSSTDGLRKTNAEIFDFVETPRQRNAGIFNNPSPKSTLNNRRKFMQEVDNSVQGLEPIGRKNISKRHEQSMFRSNYKRKHNEMKLFLEDSFLHQTLATDIILESQNSYTPEFLLDNHHIDKIIRSLERDTSSRHRNEAKIEKFL